MKLSVIKLRQILPVLAYAFACEAAALDFNRPQGARGWGLANATVTFSDIWSVQNNPAGLGFLKENSLATYMENRFRLSKLNSGSLALAIHSKEGTFGLFMNYFGSGVYSEQKYAFCYGRSFTEKFAFGFQISYQLIRIGEYGSTGCPGLEGGVIYKLSRKLHTGFHISNPGMQKLTGVPEERLPTIAKIGWNYISSEKVFIVMEVQKELDHRARLKTGTEYLVHPKLALRAGIASAPFQHTFGVGFKDERLQFDLAADIHPVLGVSPHASILFLLKKKK